MKNKLVIAAVDVGKFENIGTAANPKIAKSAEGRFTFFESLIEMVKNGIPLAIGFEAPLFIPGKIDAGMSLARPQIDGCRAWTLTSSFHCLFPILNQFFATLKTECEDVRIYTAYDSFAGCDRKLVPHPVLIFESFISGRGRNDDGDGKAFCPGSCSAHDADAELAVTLFQRFCACRSAECPESSPALFPPDGIGSYINIPKMFADHHGISFDEASARNCLILRSKKPFVKDGMWCYREADAACLVWQDKKRGRE